MSIRQISIIVALDENNLIGKRGGLPWKLPADLKHFKEITTGHTIIVGMKTYKSIGKPLPNRTNIVISRNNQNIPGCITVKSVTEAIEAAPDNKGTFVIGGAEIYSQFLPLAQRIYLTQIHHRFEGDIFFPKLNLSEWREVERQDFDPDEKNPYKYSFVTLERTRR